MTALDTFRGIIRAGVVVVPLDLGWELDEPLLNRESWRINALISMMERAHNESAVKSRIVGWRHSPRSAAERRRVWPSPELGRHG